MAAPETAPPVFAPPRGVWQLIAGSLGLYACTTQAWVTGGVEAHTYVYSNRSIEAHQIERYTGASLLLLGGLGAALVFLGLAAWLFLHRRGVPVRGQAVPPVPLWAPVTAVLYAAAGLINGIVTFLQRSAAQDGKPSDAQITFDFTGAYGWALAFFILLLVGTLLYRRSLKRVSTAS